MINAIIKLGIIGIVAVIWTAWSWLFAKFFWWGYEKWKASQKERRLGEAMKDAKPPLRVI